MLKSKHNNKNGNLNCLNKSYSDTFFLSKEIFCLMTLLKTHSMEKVLCMFLCVCEWLILTMIEHSYEFSCMLFKDLIKLFSFVL